MKVQKNGPVVTVVVIVAGSLIGMWLASMFLGGGLGGAAAIPFLIFFGNVWDLVRVGAILSVGAILGGLFFSWASKR